MADGFAASHLFLLGLIWCRKGSCILPGSKNWHVTGPFHVTAEKLLLLLILTHNLWYST
jgi:hypothetical protein